MRSKIATALAVTCLSVLALGCSATPETVTQIKRVRVTVPASLTEPVPIPQCPGCTTWGEAAELLLETQTAAESCNMRLKAIRQWSKTGDNS